MSVSETTDQSVKPLFLSGEEFLKQYSGFEFYILTKEDEFEDNIQYQDGLVEDSSFGLYDFTYKLRDVIHGIIFTKLKNIPVMLYWNYHHRYYIRKVQIPLDAKIFVQYKKFNTNKLFLEPRVPIREFNAWEDPEFCTQAVVVL